ncbi:MAG: TonB-dependent receptor [Candidatus Latescibacterota bacterium]
MPGGIHAAGSAAAERCCPRVPSVALLLVLLALACDPGLAADAVSRLAELSLEELMEVEVILPSRSPERLASATAAITVLTGEELRQLGVRSVPEALRWVPGMQVGRIDANKWEVSARGFSGLFADKLLVLIDGRSVYNPLFSGVFWEVQDVDLADVERIEVVRGPGGTLWGANALNGVINVVTRGAAQTPGLRAEVGTGDRQRVWGAGRYGGRLGREGHFRAYGRYFAQGASRGAQEPVEDAWHLGRLGARADWQVSSDEELTLDASVYAGEAGQSFLQPTSLSPPYQERLYYDAPLGGGHLLGRWQRGMGRRGDLELHAYVDRMDRRDAILRGSIWTADVDFQHRLEPVSGGELAWGLGYRLAADEYRGTFTLSMLPRRRLAHLLSGFAQGGASLLSGRTRLVAGTKVEHNGRSGLELQPNLRLGWFPTHRQTVWAALSRATRTPSRADDDILATLRVLPPGAAGPGSPLTRVVLLGNREFASEELVALEGGYRANLAEQLMVDAAAFLHRYDRLRSDEPELPYPDEASPQPHLVVPIRVSNGLDGRTWGGELALSWQPGQRWRLEGAYSFVAIDLWPDAGSQDQTTEASEEESVPRHQVGLRSHVELAPGLELNLAGRYVAELPYARIDRYATVDAHLEWRLRPRLAVSLVGINLIDSPHLEYVSRSTNNVGALVEREVYTGIRWEVVGPP